MNINEQIFEHIIIKHIFKHIIFNQIFEITIGQIYEIMRAIAKL